MTLTFRDLPQVQVKGQEGHIYSFIYLFHNTEIISIDWESEGDDTFSFQAFVITLSM